MKRSPPPLFLIRNNLGPLEDEVMRVVWKKKSLTVREVLETLRKVRTIAYTTVMTIMDSLYRKGFLKRVKIKKAYRYFPASKKIVWYVLP